MIMKRQMPMNYTTRPPHLTDIIHRKSKTIYQQNGQARYVFLPPVLLFSLSSYRLSQARELLETNSGLPSVCPSALSSIVQTTVAQNLFLLLNPFTLDHI